MHASQGSTRLGFASVQSARDLSTATYMSYMRNVPFYK